MICGLYCPQQVGDVDNVGFVCFICQDLLSYSTTAHVSSDILYGGKASSLAMHLSNKYY